jgi:hypothetical protein
MAILRREWSSGREAPTQVRVRSGSRVLETRKPRMVMNMDIVLGIDDPFQPEMSKEEVMISARLTSL